MEKDFPINKLSPDGINEYQFWRNMGRSHKQALNMAFNADASGIYAYQQDSDSDSDSLDELPDVNVRQNIHTDGRGVGQLTHCLRCKKKTGNTKETHATTKNGRNMIKSVCPDCGGGKSRFTK